MDQNKSSGLALLLKQASQACNRLAPEKTPGNTGLKQAYQAKRAFSPSRLCTGTHTHTDDGARASPCGVAEKPDKPDKPVSSQQRRGFQRNRLLDEPDKPVSEQDPADWQGEVEPPAMRNVRYWRHGETRQPPNRGTTPYGTLWECADWLDSEGFGPVAVIEDDLAHVAAIAGRARP